MTYDRDDVYATVAKLAAEQVAADPASVDAHTNFVADLNYDSLNQVEFVMELEDAFEISISDELADRARTVGDAVELVVAVLKGDRSEAQNLR